MLPGDTLRLRLRRFRGLAATALAGPELAVLEDLDSVLSCLPVVFFFPKEFLFER